jgi:c-di-GMP-binding flagellar brake protein YcgR
MIKLLNKIRIPYFLLLFPPKELDNFLKSFSSDSKKSNPKIILLFLVIIIFLLLLIIIKYYFQVRKSNKKIEQILSKKNSPPLKKEKDFRNTRRVNIPSSMDLKIIFSEGSVQGNIGLVKDISRGGIGFEPNFPLRKLYVEELLSNVTIKNGDVFIIIKKARVIRIQHQYHRRIIALKFLDMDSANRDALIKLIAKISPVK